MCRIIKVVGKFESESFIKSFSRFNHLILVTNIIKEFIKAVFDKIPEGVISMGRKEHPLGFGKADDDVYS